MRPRVPSSYPSWHRLVLLVSMAAWCRPTLLAGQRSFPNESNNMEERTVRVEGRVSTENGRTIPSGVMVKLLAGGQQFFEQPASSAGQFEFSEVPKVYLQLVVSAEGFQTYERDLDLTHAANMVVVNVNLVPSSQARAAPVALPSMTDAKASKKARSEYQKGARALEEKKWAEAQAHLSKAVKEYDCYARAQTDLAVVWSAQRQFLQAEQSLQKAIACDPDFVNAYTELGQLYYDEKKFTESEALLKEGLRRSPGAWQFYYQLGATHYRLGKYKEAEGEFLRAQTFSPPPPPEIHVKLADVYLRESNYPKAYTEMQAYLRDEPAGRFAGKVRDIMRQMEADGTPRSAQTSIPIPPPSKP